MNSYYVPKRIAWVTNDKVIWGNTQITNYMIDKIGGYGDYEVSYVVSYSKTYGSDRGFNTATGFKTIEDAKLWCEQVHYKSQLDKILSPIIPTLSRTDEWFCKAKPYATVDNFVQQYGFHIEEISEMFESYLSEDKSQASSKLVSSLQSDVAEFNDTLTESLKIKKNFVDFVDALADQIVTAVGVLRYLGLNPIDVVDEVNKSNWSKFDKDGNPIINPDTGKIMKDKGYLKPDLSLIAHDAWESYVSKLK